MKKTTILLTLAVILAAASCEKNNGIVVPPPTGKTAAPEDGNNNSGDNSGDNNGGGTSSGTLCTDIGQTPIILAYYTEYNEKAPDPSLITHINYAHGLFKNPKTGDGGIVITESKKVPIKNVIALKEKNPKLKVMLMVGGWGAHADGFSMMARDAAKRAEFCHSINQHMKNHKLDGIDIDWEYPTQSADNETGCDPSDTKNFNILLKELRDTLGTDKIISFASSSSAKYVDWPTAIKYIDYVNVMTYDMGAAPNGHNSALYKSNTFSSRSCDESVELHRKAGVPLNRQVMGIPFYGKAEKNPASGTQIFEYSVKYYEIPAILNDGKYKDKPLARPVYRRWESTAKVPYLVDDSGKNVLSYDDPESMAEKGAYIKSKGLLGGMFWEFRYDTSDFQLQKALAKAIYGKESVL